MDIEKMYNMYESGLTLREVGEAFNISGQHVKNLLEKHGFKTRSKPKTRKSTSKLSKASFDWENKKAQWDLLDTKVKGEIAENYVKNKLLELGFEVWISITPNTKFDLAVMCHNSNRLNKVQVKCATYTSDKRFRANLTTKDKQKNHIRYKNNDTDFFIIYCPFVSEFYVIPFAIVASINSVNLLPHRDRLTSVENIYESYLNAFDLLCKS